MLKTTLVIMLAFAATHISKAEQTLRDDITAKLTPTTGAPTQYGWLGLVGYHDDNMYTTAEVLSEIDSNPNCAGAVLKQFKASTSSSSMLETQTLTRENVTSSMLETQTLTRENEKTEDKQGALSVIAMLAQSQEALELRSTLMQETMAKVAKLRSHSSSHKSVVGQLVQDIEGMALKLLRHASSKEGHNELALLEMGSKGFLRSSGKRKTVSRSMASNFLSFSGNSMTAEQQAQQIAQECESECDPEEVDESCIGNKSFQTITGFQWCDCRPCITLFVSLAIEAAVCFISGGAGCLAALAKELGFKKVIAGFASAAGVGQLVSEVGCLLSQMLSALGLCQGMRSGLIKFLGAIVTAMTGNLSLMEQTSSEDIAQQVEAHLSSGDALCSDAYIGTVANGGGTGSLGTQAQSVAVKIAMDILADTTAVGFFGGVGAAVADAIMDCQTECTSDNNLCLFSCSS